MQGATVINIHCDICQNLIRHQYQVDRQGGQEREAREKKILKKFVKKQISSASSLMRVKVFLIVEANSGHRRQKMALVII